MTGKITYPAIDRFKFIFAFGAYELNMLFARAMRYGIGNVVFQYDFNFVFLRIAGKRLRNSVEYGYAKLICLQRKVIKQ